MVNRKGLFPVGHKTNLGKRMPTAGFPKGNIPWNAGKKLSQEYREKLSKAHMGLPNKRKGTGVRAKFSDTYEYARWRSTVYMRDGYTCQMCSKVGGRLNAHHIFPVSLFPERVFDVENGKTLCFPCHTKTDTFGLNISIAKQRELQERLSEQTCSEVWEETLRNVQRLEAETKAEIVCQVSNASKSALASL